MAPPTEPLIEAPAGWQLNNFWANLGLEVAAHRTALGCGALFFAVLVLARALLTVPARRRLGIPFFLLVSYFISVPVRVELLSLGSTSGYLAVKLSSDIALAWGTIAVVSLLLFSLLGSRFGIAKIIADVMTVIGAVGALVFILARSGVNLLSLITTSAVLTVVIGLALQDTLGNLLAGIALEVEASFAIGDWIRIDDRSIGKVLEIRWRSTLMQTKNGDLVVIPNALVTKGVITNFNKDELQNRRWIYVNVPFRHPPNLVQKVVLDAVRDVPNVSAATPPDCVLWSYEDGFIRYALRYRLVDYLPDDPTDSDVRKRLWYAFQRHQIELGLPGRRVVVADGEGDPESSDRELARLAALERVDFLAPLDEHERRHLANGLRHLSFGSGETIIRSGELGDTLYIVAAGRVTVKIDVGSLERQIAQLGEGEFFGEMSLMTGEPRSATVVAEGDVDCYVLERSLFQEVLRNNASLVDDIGKLLSERELALRGQRAGLTLEAERQRAEHHQALLERVKVFLGLP